jgi:hypothetical protein
MKTVKPDMKANAKLRNIENFENERIWAKLCRTRSVYENSIRNTDPQCITINKYHHGKFRVQVSRLINLVSLTREKKRKRKKRKIWDVISTRLERIATTSGTSSSLFWSTQSHTMQQQRCVKPDAAMQHRARWLVLPRWLREARRDELPI